MKMHSKFNLKKGNKQAVSLFKNNDSSMTITVILLQSMVAKWIGVFLNEQAIWCHEA
jgi:hypothetical protein